MDFRVKAAVQHAFSVIPGGWHLNHLLATHLTGTRKASDAWLDEFRRRADRHVAAFVSRHHRLPSRVFEFGSGWDLKLAILVGLKGCTVVASDIEAHAVPGAVRDILRRLGARSLETANVTYRAPCDARGTGLPAGTFDLVMSTSVLEHIPPADIPAVLAECRRLLAPDGVCSFQVDYKDHWCYSDRSITHHNYMRFGAGQWKLYNPPLQYQNRLRHSDYLRLFEQAGFDVAAEPQVEDLPAFPLAPEFRHYGEADLRTTRSWVVLVNTG